MLSALERSVVWFTFQCDRLASDMAVELKKRGVVSVSLWPGAVQTELVSQFILEKDEQPVDSKVNSSLFVISYSW